jgi:hypothetical protein
MRLVRLLLLVGLVAVACATEPSPGPGAGSDSGAPDFSVETFDDGPFALADQKGKIVVLNFFESW